MGCYGAVLANGAEYTGNYGVHITIDDLVTFHRERLSICLQGSCNFSLRGCSHSILILLVEL